MFQSLSYLASSPNVRIYVSIPLSFLCVMVCGNFAGLGRFLMLYIEKLESLLIICVPSWNIC